jgi:hypothetical protein
MSTLISALSTLTGSVNNNTDVFPVLDQTISSAANKNKKARITAHNLFYSNNFTISGLNSYGNYFGTGKDGSVTISGSAQVSSSLNNISNEYGDTIVKNYQSLTIDSGILFSPLRACRGMVIYCTGNLTVNGTISMTGKGGGVATKIAAPIGVASSTDSRFDLVDATLYFNNLSSSASGGRGIPTHWNWAPSGSAWFSNFKVRVPLSGSVAGGAAGAWQGTGAAGPAGIFCCGSGGGGGGGGYYSQPAAGGAGSRGTIFTGGSGGGGGGWAYATGGTGTYEVSAPAAGSGGTGAGGAGGNSSGVGGLLILIVRGNITINGTLSSNGATGGTGTSPGEGPNANYQSGGGGGSGGGRIMIIYGGTYANTGTIVTNGGSGAGGNLGNYVGGAGGAGSTTVKKVHV